MEDRRTELLAVALEAHRDFCVAVIEDVGVQDAALAARIEVRTQVTLQAEPRLIDLVVRCYDQDEVLVAVVFFENKFTRSGQINPYGFSTGQARRQRLALTEERCPVRRLVGVSTELPARPPGYDLHRTWRHIAALAEGAGGPAGWQRQARRPDAVAAQRILLEIITYLKEETLGALELEDVEALGRRTLADERVNQLLEDVARQLEEGWQREEGATDWTSPGGLSINYVSLEPADGSWLVEQRNGERLVFICDGSWDSDLGLMRPVVYVGSGWKTDRGEREQLDKSPWRTSLPDDRTLLSDPGWQSSYLVKTRTLESVVTEGAGMHEQAEVLADWARGAFADIDVLAPPPRPPKAVPRRRRG